jgi:hypothetical protein
MFVRIAVFLALVGLPAQGFGQAVVRDDFESPQTVLRPAGGDARHTVETHARIPKGAHSGRWCEQLRITGNNGAAVYYAYPVNPARIIDELAAGLWVRADRPGLQIVARVVLPRTRHPTTGEPLTTLLRGSDYQQVGSWQILEIGNLSRALEWQTRVLRLQFGPQVDPREAYVDLVLLNVYGGPGTTNVWVDDFEAVGIVAPAGASASRAGAAADVPPYLSAPAAPSAPSVELKGRLTVGGEPFFPRIVDHRGEPLAYLKNLGFNGVRLAAAPSRELLAEAAAAGMWLFAPPPDATPAEAGRGGGLANLGNLYDPVLAWDLGSGLSTRELEFTRRRAELVRAADPRERPIVCAPDSDLAGYTRRPFGVLLAHREPLGTSLELAQYSNWLAERTQLARGGSPLWAAIPTQPTPPLVQQMRLVAGMPLAAPLWQEAQIRALVRAALASRARGLVFTSQSRLDAPDPAARTRALTLQLVNLELELLERWPAAGDAAAAANSSDRHTTGGVLHTQRSRLLLPIYAPPQGQFVLGTQPAAQIAFTVAGVPEGDNAYELSLASLRPLRSQRVAGGTQVVLDESTRDSLVVFSEDPYVLRNLKTWLAKNAARAAQTARELATARLAAHDATVARLAQIGRTLPATAEARAKAGSDLQQCDALLKTDVAKAYDHATHALAIVRQIERVYWEQAAGAAAAPLADPLAASFATLPDHYRFRAEIASAARSENRLPEGGLENLSAMLRAGWKHYLHEQQGIKTRVDLTPRAAHSGAAGLLLRAEPESPKQKPAAVETPPLWVTTAPVALEPGDLVEIRAWVRIDKPITGSVDGLAILDSLSGEPLAVRLSQTQGWKEITLYRAAPRGATLEITFALAGLGEAAIDDVSVALIRRGAASAAQAQR